MTHDEDEIMPEGGTGDCSQGRGVDDYIRDVEDVHDFVEDYLSRCVKYSLKRARGSNIEAAYRVHS